MSKWKHTSMMEVSGGEHHSIPKHNGEPIPSWSETGKEYLVLEKFPHLQKRFHSGFDCLDPEERAQLHQLISQRKEELKTKTDYLCPLHHKVSLLAGGNVANVTADAVVNASNHWLTPGKGVDGAIHSAAGDCLLNQCLSLGGCAVGEAKLTPGYNLSASHVIHTVGPGGNDKNRSTLLMSCYKSSLSLLSAHGFHSIAFPCISTGMYQYPSLEAADIALSTVREWLLDKDNLDNVDRVVFVTRSTKNEELYSLLMLVYFPLV